MRRSHTTIAGAPTNGEDRARHDKCDKGLPTCPVCLRCPPLSPQWATSWRKISPCAMARTTACTRVATPNFFMAR